MDGVSAFTTSEARSKGMKVGEQGVHLVLSERVAELGHHTAAALYGLAHKTVVGGQTAWQKLLPKEPFQFRTLLAAGRISIVTRTAISVENSAAGCLLRIESQFGVRFHAMIAATRSEKRANSQSKQGE